MPCSSTPFGCAEPNIFDHPRVTVGRWLRLWLRRCADACGARGKDAFAGVEGAVPGVALGDGTSPLGIVIGRSGLGIVSAASRARGCGKLGEVGEGPVAAASYESPEKCDVSHMFLNMTPFRRPATAYLIVTVSRVVITDTLFVSPNSLYFLQVIMPKRKA